MDFSTPKNTMLVHDNARSNRFASMFLFLFVCTYEIKQLLATEVRDLTGFDKSACR